MSGKATNKFGLEAQELMTLLQRCFADHPSNSLCNNNQCLEISDLTTTDLGYWGGLGSPAASRWSASHGLEIGSS